MGTSLETCASGGCSTAFLQLFGGRIFHRRIFTDRLSFENCAILNVNGTPLPHLPQDPVSNHAFIALILQVLFAVIEPA